MKSLLIVYSYHHQNTQRIADAFAQVLDAEVKTPDQVNPTDLVEYDLVGFGSGIYGGKHHKRLLDLADRLPDVADGQAFLFSTCGVPAFAAEGGHVEDYMQESHAALREKLRSKGYPIIGEFNCVGWNTNSFLKLFGGINKGRPNAADLKRAKVFAREVRQKALGTVKKLGECSDSTGGYRR
jgi:flavodoxin